MYKLYEEEGTNNKRYRLNYLPVCMIVAILSLMFDNKMERTAALMDKRLLILLKRNGVVYEQIGHPVEFNGIRSPYFIHLQESYDNLRSDFKKLFTIIHEEINSSKTVLVNG